MSNVEEGKKTHVQRVHRNLTLLSLLTSFLFGIGSYNMHFTPLMVLVLKVLGYQL